MSQYAASVGAAFKPLQNMYRIIAPRSSDVFLAGGSQASDVFLAGGSQASDVFLAGGSQASDVFLAGGSQANCLQPYVD
ncbi:hypothetical protein [Streptomyces lutosisoli]|uniref:Uncharacterized protein n=1 Tax=Streptomyces lutosisoli TaxID=2665721 RepID=A0ABW2VZW9_9ACTN